MARGGLTAIHLGHRDIHENQIGPEALEQLNRFAPIVGKDQFDIQVAHHFLKDQLVGAIVFSRQNPHGAWSIWDGWRRRWCDNHRLRNATDFLQFAVKIGAQDRFLDDCRQFLGALLLRA